MSHGLGQKMGEIRTNSSIRLGFYRRRSDPAGDSKRFQGDTSV